jgi:hypothetical protein
MVTPPSKTPPRPRAHPWKCRLYVPSAGGARETGAEAVVLAPNIADAIQPLSIFSRTAPARDPTLRAEIHTIAREDLSSRATYGRAPPGARHPSVSSYDGYLALLARFMNPTSLGSRGFKYGHGGANPPGDDDEAWSESNLAGHTDVRHGLNIYL